MENKSICKTITLSGMPLSGKSTQMAYLVDQYQKLGYEVKTISVGDIFRNIARKRGITITELNEQLMHEKGIDEIIDTGVVREYEEKVNSIPNEKRPNTVFLIDSRLAWKNIPNSFSVRIVISKDVAAQRLYSANRGEEDTYNSVEEAAESWEERKNAERERYQEIYSIDLDDTDNYDLVIDSSDMQVEEIGRKIMETEQKTYNESGYKKIAKNFIREEQYR